eukprot:CAMPEP_0168329338 /NCGR_PEP_ID=MMETSP0213-20121227/7051_1 /TAXON_ID=151035 /ORGANISM="Euplotes harpa, Strain FSP1.4" /LENGTH=198 /DNA_ID=CAMNT_0008332649 /DNA_START=232 /DNA_END=828 /DNA_ORIENTATION=-
MPSHFAIGDAKAGCAGKQAVRDKVLDTPEEIRKWVQSRRRNYPSKKNIERKKEIVKRKAEMGIPVTRAEVDGEGVSLLERKLMRKVKMVSMEEKRGKGKGFKGKGPPGLSSEAWVTPGGVKDVGEDGEVKEKKRERKEGEKVKEKKMENGKEKRKDIVKFRYKKNTIYQDIFKKEKDNEASVILQCFRYMVKQNIFKC